MHLGCGEAEPFRLAREVPAHLVGMQVTFGEQVTDARRRKRPPVDGQADERLEQRDRRRRAVEWRLDPAERRGYGFASAFGERAGELQVGVRARLQPTEELADV